MLVNRSCPPYSVVVKPYFSQLDGAKQTAAIEYKWLFYFDLILSKFGARKCCDSVQVQKVIELAAQQVKQAGIAA